MSLTEDEYDSFKNVLFGYYLGCSAYESTSRGGGKDNKDVDQENVNTRRRFVDNYFKRF